MDNWRITVKEKRVTVAHDGEHFYTSSRFEKAGSAEGLAALFRIAAALYGHPFASEQDPAPGLGPRARADRPGADQAGQLPARKIA